MHTKLCLILFIFHRYVCNVLLLKCVPITHPQISNETCPKGFGLKLANLGLKIPLKSQAAPMLSRAEPSCTVGLSRLKIKAFCALLN